MVVSVIVPIYKSVKGIDTLLSALLNQCFPLSATEIILIEETPTGHTAEIVYKFQTQSATQISLLDTAGQRGAYVARNYGIQVAQGEILAFTEADCIPRPDWLTAGVCALSKGKARCGGGEVRFTYRAARPNPFEYYDAAVHCQQQKTIMLAGFAATTNLFVHAALFQLYGCFRTDLLDSADQEFGWRITRAGEGINYLTGAIVERPARSTLPWLYQGVKQAERSRKKLAQSGIMQREMGSLFAPRFNPLHRPINRNWPGTLSAREKMQVILVHQIVTYSRLWLRVAGRLERI